MSYPSWFDLLLCDVIFYLEVTVTTYFDSLFWEQACSTARVHLYRLAHVYASCTHISTGSKTFLLATSYVDWPTCTSKPKIRSFFSQVGSKVNIIVVVCVGPFQSSTTLPDSIAVSKPSLTFSSLVLGRLLFQCLLTFPDPGTACSGTY